MVRREKNVMNRRTLNGLKHDKVTTVLATAVMIFFFGAQYVSQTFVKPKHSRNSTVSIHSSFNDVRKLYFNLNVKKMHRKIKITISAMQINKK